MKLFIGSIIIFAGLLSEDLAFSQATTTYTGDTVGTFENPADWTDGAPNANLQANILPGARYISSDDFGQIDNNTTLTITETTNEAAAGLEISSAYNLDNNNSTVAGIVNFNLTPGFTLTVGQNYNDGIDVTNQSTLNFSGGTIDLVSGNIIIGDVPFIFELTGLGALNITSGTIQFNSGSSTMYVGTGTGSTGTVTESGLTTLVTGDNLLIGDDESTGTYNLETGTLSLDGDVRLGDSMDSSGTLNQSGGTFNDTGTTDLVVGGSGTGLYTISLGTANISSGLQLGEFSGGNGTVMQSGGTVTVAGQTVIGNAGVGSYSIGSGSANFEGGLVIGAQSGSTGTFTQNGGTVVVANGLALTNAGSSYLLNAGSLQVDTITGVAGEGTLNFNGGTLITTGSLTDALNGTLNGSSGINATGTIILSGTLTGTGSLAIGSGTVQASTSNLPQISGVTLATGSTLDLTTSGNATDTFAGTISGGGNLQTGATGVDDAGNPILAPVGYRMILTKTVNLTNGTTTIANNTGLQVGNGTLNTITGGTGTSLEIGGIANGKVTGLGTATVANITIDSGSTLHLGNTVGNVLNNGTFGTTTPDTTMTGIGTLNQPQQSTLAGEGTLVVNTNGATSDLYHTNTANLFGTVEVLGVGSHTYTIVTTAAPGDLTTGALNTVGPTGLSTTHTTLFTSVLTEDNDQNLVLTTIQSNLSPFAKTPNQTAVAGAIDTVIQNPPESFVPLLLQINSLGLSSIPGALDQLTPRPYLYMRDLAFENSTFLAQKVDGFLGNLRTGYSGLDTSGLSFVSPGMESGLGRSLGSLLAYNNEGLAPNGVNYYPGDGESAPVPPGMAEPTPAGPATISDSTDPRMAPTTPPPPSTSIFDGQGVGFNEFVSGNVVLADLTQKNAGGDQPTAHTVAGDATAGVSFRMNSNLAAGVLVDYNHTDARTDSEGSHVRVDSYSPGLFATFFERGFYVNGLATFGYNDYSDTRKLNLGGAGLSASSSPNGEQYAGNLDAGYDFHPDPHWVVGPTASLGYAHLDVDSFQENGAGSADLSVHDQSADSLRGRLGGRVVYLVHSGSILFQPNLTLAVQHEFLNDPFHLASSLNIPGTPSFETQGGNPGRNSALIGFGLTTTLDNSMNLYLNYLAEIGGDDYFVQSVEGGIKASF